MVRRLSVGDDRRRLKGCAAVAGLCGSGGVGLHELLRPCWRAAESRATNRSCPGLLPPKAHSEAATGLTPGLDPVFLRLCRDDLAHVCDVGGRGGRCRRAIAALDSVHDRRVFPGRAPGPVQRPEADRA
jgi:hypothetical protein